MTEYKIILVRHGQSKWNALNVFTGWVNVDLSDKGKDEATLAGQLIKKYNFKPDTVFTSVLSRSINTSKIILNELDSTTIKQVSDFHLNERHYGALQGLNKAQVAETFGKEQVHVWRRSYDIPPPIKDLGLPKQKFPDDPRNKKEYSESLKDTFNRVVPYWKDTILPEILSKKNVMIVAHGNSIRALIKHIDSVNDKDIVKIEIPTGTPIVYEFNKNMEPIKHYYLH